MNETADVKDYATLFQLQNRTMKVYGEEIHILAEDKAAEILLPVSKEEKHSVWESVFRNSSSLRLFHEEGLTYVRKVGSVEEMINGYALSGEMLSYSIHRREQMKNRTFCEAYYHENFGYSFLSFTTDSFSKECYICPKAFNILERVGSYVLEMKVVTEDEETFLIIKENDEVIAKHVLTLEGVTECIQTILSSSRLQTFFDLTARYLHLSFPNWILPKEFHAGLDLQEHSNIVYLTDYLIARYFKMEMTAPQMLLALEKKGKI